MKIIKIEADGDLGLEIIDVTDPTIYYRTNSDFKVIKNYTSKSRDILILYKFSTKSKNST